MSFEKNGNIIFLTLFSKGGNGGIFVRIINYLLIFLSVLGILLIILEIGVNYKLSNFTVLSQTEDIVASTASNSLDLTEELILFPFLEEKGKSHSNSGVTYESSYHIVSNDSIVNEKNGNNMTNMGDDCSVCISIRAIKSDMFQNCEEKNTNSFVGCRYFLKQQFSRNKIFDFPDGLKSIHANFLDAKSISRLSLSNSTDLSHITRSLLQHSLRKGLFIRFLFSTPILAPSTYSIKTDCNQKNLSTIEWMNRFVCNLLFLNKDKCRKNLREFSHMGQIIHPNHQHKILFLFQPFTNEIGVSFFRNYSKSEQSSEHIFPIQILRSSLASRAYEWSFNTIKANISTIEAFFDIDISNHSLFFEFGEMAVIQPAWVHNGNLEIKLNVPNPSQYSNEWDHSFVTQADLITTVANSRLGYYNHEFFQRIKGFDQASSHVYSQEDISVCLANMEMSISGNGFHRTIITDILYNDCAELFKKTASCQIVAIDILSNSVFVDIYEIEQLARFGGNRIEIFDEIDLEKPSTSPFSSQIAVVTFCPHGLKECRLSLPIHGRYHEPSSHTRYANVSIVPPQVYIYCPIMTLDNDEYSYQPLYSSKVGMSEVIGRKIRQDLNQQWHAVSFSLQTLEKQEISFQLPVGISSDNRLVTILTCITTIIGASVLIFFVLTK